MYLDHEPNANVIMRRLVHLNLPQTFTEKVDYYIKDWKFFVAQYYLLLLGFFLVKCITKSCWKIFKSEWILHGWKQSITDFVSLNESLLEFFYYTISSFSNSIWLEISIKWHTMNQGPTKKCIHFTSGRNFPCPAHKACT